MFPKQIRGIAFTGVLRKLRSQGGRLCRTVGDPAINDRSRRLERISGKRRQAASPWSISVPAAPSRCPLQEHLTLATMSGVFGMMASVRKPPDSCAGTVALGVN